MIAKIKTSAAKGSFAAFIADQIDSGEKTQRQIANEMGYDKPNVISMMKKGRMPVPLDKVPALAHALGVDPLYLFDKALKEYNAEIRSALTEALGVLVTKNEQEHIVRLRKYNEGQDIHYTDEAAKSTVEFSK